MTQIKIKRVYEDPEAEDGYRVLVDRLWPRGMKKEHLKYDVWEKDITPLLIFRSLDIRVLDLLDIKGSCLNHYPAYRKHLTNIFYNGKMCPDLLSD